MLKRNGATLLVSMLMNKNKLTVRCNSSSQRKDNNRFWKDLQVALQISLLLITQPIKIIYSVSAKRKLMKPVKNYILWKLVILLLINKNSRRVLILQCLLMFKVTSQYLCKQLKAMEWFILLLRWVTFTCLKSHKHNSYSDKESLIL